MTLIQLIVLPKIKILLMYDWEKNQFSNLPDCLLYSSMLHLFDQKYSKL